MIKLHSLSAKKARILAFRINWSLASLNLTDIKSLNHRSCSNMPASKIEASLKSLSLTFALALVLGGCSALGGKNPPDEFAITTKAPLVVPPDYALSPPKPGESRPQELSSSERAQQVLLGDTTSTPPSEGEVLILSKSGALKADRNIRNILNAENGGRGEKDSSLANQLVFWKFGDDGTIDDSAAPLRVDDPDEWMRARAETISKVIGEDGQIIIDKDDSKVLNLPGVF